MRLCSSVAVLLLYATVPLGAQANQANDSSGVHVSATSSASELIQRAEVGAVGAGVGIVGGALLGYSAAAFLPLPGCNCDDPGLSEIAIGAAIGTVAGAALAAALPEQRSQCSFAERVGLGLLGAAVGGTLGFVAARGGHRLILIPVGAGSGAGVLSAFC